MVRIIQIWFEYGEIVIMVVIAISLWLWLCYVCG